MTASSPSIIERYHAWPRSVRWLFWLAVVVVLYFGIVEPMLLLRANLADRSEAALLAIDTYGRPDPHQEIEIARGRQYWGDVALPGADRSRVIEARNRITAILSEHQVTRDWSIQERTTGVVQVASEQRGGTPLQYQRGQLEVKFNAAPHVAAAIIADLEGEPVITQLSRTQLRRLTDRTELEVIIVAEAWHK